jgi:hypothetical protein
MARPRKDDDTPAPKRPPATTVQGRENQLTSLAVDLAEKQLREGTASSQVVTHFLKLATVREELEREKIRSENALLKKREETLASGANMEELTKEAIQAFTTYKPTDTPDEYLDD